MEDFVSLLRHRADLTPDRLALRVLVDGEQDVREITYSQLEERARAIAVVLRESTRPGDRVLLLYPSGIDFIAAFLGCLFSGTVAIPVSPPHPARIERTLGKLMNIAEDAGVTTVLCSDWLYGAGRTASAENPQLGRFRWINTDEISNSAASAWTVPEITPDSLAFLQYTSGSTGFPKGVMVSHRGLLLHGESASRAFTLTENSVWVSWLPLYHDMGLVGGVLLPLQVGCPSVLMSPLHFLQRPLRWLQAVSRYGGTICAAPNFAYELCAQRIKDEEKEDLDLCSWTHALNGSEPVRARTLDAFAQAFERCGFRRSALHPGYGMAEATLVVSCARKAEEPWIPVVHKGELEKGRVELVPEGHPEAQRVCSVGAPVGLTARVVDPETQELAPAGTTGEIWLSAPFIAQGYWNRAEETERTFKARIASTGEGPFLRTGDLGFVLDGELFISGRLKDLIILGGRKIHPPDLEGTVEAVHPAVRSGGVAAFPTLVDETEKVVVVVELERRHGSDLSELDARIRKALYELHEVIPHDIVFVKAGTIPKTTSGKTQRRACRGAYEAGELAVLRAEVA
jgi:acyl-CoA synthetase (AMP-forming)/AMP-acid ligase II